MDDIEPLPETGMSKILGLCEALQALGGSARLHRVASELHLDLNTLLRAVQAGEQLGLLETPGPQAVLTPLGQEVLSALPAERKRLVAARLAVFPLFWHVLQLLARAPRRALPRELLLEELAIHLPEEEPQQQFDVLVNWGRYADLLGYSKDGDEVFLQGEEEQPAR